MKIFYAILAIFLAGCSGAYKSLEESYKVDSLEGTPTMKKISITFTGPAHKGAESYQQLADLYLTEKSIGVSISMPMFNKIYIPREDIQACSMTCFGTKDRYMDMTIPKKGIIISVPDNQELQDWCWNNKKIIYPGDIQRNWEYKGAQLPPPDPSAPQFNSREAYNKQLYQSCIGY